MAEKCRAKTKRGTDCRAVAVKGTCFCGLHGDPKRAAELGRMGGLRNRHYVDTEPVIINAPKTPEDVTNVLVVSWSICGQKKWTRRSHTRSPI